MKLNHHQFHLVYVVTGAELTLRHHNFYKSCLGSNHHLLDAALTCPMAQFVVYVHQRLSVRLMLNDSMRILKPYWNIFLQAPKVVKWSMSMLEINDIHLLNWGSTHMAGFLDVCIQASNIIVPFLDTIISGSIQSDETKFLTSPKGNDIRCKIFTYIL